MRWEVNVLTGERVAIQEDAPPSPPQAMPTDPNLRDDLVDAERDRRMALGFEFNGKVFQYRPLPKEDRANIDKARTSAMIAQINGPNNEDGNLRWSDPTMDFGFIAADNSVMTMDVATTIAFGTKASEHTMKHYFAARQLKYPNQTPADYADDKYWPARVL